MEILRGFQGPYWDCVRILFETLPHLCWAYSWETRIVHRSALVCQRPKFLTAYCSLHCCTLFHMPNRTGHNTWRKASDTCRSDQPHHNHQCLRAGRACISKGAGASMHFPKRYMAVARSRSFFSAGSPYNTNSGVHVGDL